jgi:[ribosomal protein S5]-alanine N-acetyltransferase
VIQTQTMESFLQTSVVANDWRQALPILSTDVVTLRELRLSDAPALLAMLGTEEVSRFVAPPPSTVEGFERFIHWAHKDRAAGRFVCFGIVPAGCDQAVGIIQVRATTASFDTAEWGFAMGSTFWGTGVFLAAAREVLNFTFDVVGAHRLEARAAVANGRGNGALQKIGATREGLLRKSLLRDGAYHDQVVWSICGDEWRQSESIVTH